MCLHTHVYGNSPQLQEPPNGKPAISRNPWCKANMKIPKPTETFISLWTSVCQQRSCPELRECSFRCPNLQVWICPSAGPWLLSAIPCQAKSNNFMITVFGCLLWGVIGDVNRADVSNLFMQTLGVFMAQICTSYVRAVCWPCSP